MSKSSFVAAGDLFITRKLPEKGYEGMQELVDFVEKQDIRFVNLEVTVHDREGYPFGFSGGTWAMAHPSLLKDVKKYGFNVYNSANNHSMDYSHNGLLATTKYLKQDVYKRQQQWYPDVDPKMRAAHPQTAQTRQRHHLTMQQHLMQRMKEQSRSVL